MTKVKRIFFIIYFSILFIFLLSLITLSILGNKNRIGYLTDFQLDIDKTDRLNTLYDAKTNYVYKFKIRYYDKIFRNNDIYGVYPNLSNLPEFIKEARMDKAGSPFGELIASQNISLDKIDNIDYKLKIKLIIYFYLFLFIFIYLIIIFIKNYSNININIKLLLINNRAKLSLPIITLLILFIVIYLIGNKEHKGFLTNFDIIGKSELGYIYKSSINSKNIFFNKNVIYSYNDSKIIFNNPNYIKLGYNIRLNDIPYGYDKELAYIYKNKSDIIFSNSINYNFYNHLIPIKNGDDYKISIIAKNINIKYGNIKIYFDYFSNNKYITNTDNIPYEYTNFNDIINIFLVKDKVINSYPTFYFPHGILSIKSIDIEQINNNLIYKDGYGFIITSQKILNYSDTFDINYTLKYSKYIYYIFISLSILLIILYIKYIYLLLNFLIRPINIFLYKLLNNNIIDKLLSIFYKLSYFNCLFNNKSYKYALVLSSLFFVITFITELKLFDSEINREVTVIHPHYYILTANYLNPFFLSNSYYSNFGYEYRNPSIIDGRRNIKDNFQIYFDVWSDNHIQGNIYAALKTGKNLDELRSFNFVRGLHYITNNQPFATKEDFESPTFYFSVPHLMARIIYGIYPNDLNNINSIDKEIKAGIFNNNIKKGLILINLLLWSLLIYTITLKFGAIYSTLIALMIFCYPGASVIYPNLYNTLTLFPLFPLYILIFHNRNKIIFLLLLSILIFIQWNLVHWMSLYFQLPIILLTLCLCNFIEQIKMSEQNIIINHIKKYIYQYIYILLISILFTAIVIKINYDEALRLQPDSKGAIDYAIFYRQGVERKLSLVFMNDDKEYLNKSHFIYSAKRRILHNIACFKRYLSYPIIYPTWRIEQYLHNYINKFIYMNKKPYISLNILLYFGLFLNVVIFFRYKYYRKKLIIPNIFAFAILIWGLIYFNFDGRVSSHFHIFPHIILIVIGSSFLIYDIYLSKLLIKLYKNNNSLNLKV